MRLRAKPDMILLFGLKETEGMVSHYYRDEKNDLWVGGSTLHR